MFYIPCCSLHYVPFQIRILENPFLFNLIGIKSPKQLFIWCTRRRNHYFVPTFFKHTYAGIIHRLFYEPFQQNSLSVVNCSTTSASRSLSLEVQRHHCLWLNAYKQHTTLQTTKEFSRCVLPFRVHRSEKCSSSFRCTHKERKHYQQKKEKTEFIRGRMCFYRLAFDKCSDLLFFVMQWSVFMECFEKEMNTFLGTKRRSVGQRYNRQCFGDD